MHRASIAIKEHLDPDVPSSAGAQNEGGASFALGVTVLSSPFFFSASLATSLRSNRQSNSSSRDPEANRSHDRSTLHPGEGSVFFPFASLTILKIDRSVRGTVVDCFRGSSRACLSLCVLYCIVGCLV